MALSRHTHPILWRWSLTLGIWGALALFSCFQIWTSRTMMGIEPSFWRVVVLELPVWVYWVLATMLGVLFSRRWPLDRAQVALSAGLHLIAGILVALGFVSFKLLWYQAFNPTPILDVPTSHWFWRYFRDNFVDGMVLYWAIVGVYHAFASASRAEQAELAVRVAKGELAQQTLKVLRQQLHPHFLFNTLNTVSAVLENDPRGARRIIGSVGDLLRAALQTEGDSLITLQRELALLEQYVAIERARFGDRIRVDVCAPDGVLAALVPAFLLQPLVENAFRHGLAPRSGAGVVSVVVQAHETHLLLVIRDDGEGLRTLPTFGVGLENTRQRLRQHYGDNIQFAIANRSDGTRGAEVSMRLPLQFVGDPDVPR